VIGRNGDHLAITVEDGSGTLQRVIWWRADQEDVPAEAFDLAYTVRANTFRGERRLQVEWLDARPVQAAVPEAVIEIPRRLIEDYRREPHPETLLAPWMQRPGAQLWAEGVTLPGARTRLELEPGPVLILWTAPPGPEELATALQVVNPQEIALFCHHPALDEINPFLQQLIGRVKYALSHKEGRIVVPELAAAIAHREITIRRGLAWMEAHGDLTLIQEEGEITLVARGGAKNASALARRTAELVALLEETAAYRNYFARTGVELLF